MASLSRFSMWIGGIAFAATLAGCTNRVQPPTEISHAGQPTHFPANNCRSHYALTSQKGCVAGLPHVTAKNVSR